MKEGLTSQQGEANKQRAAYEEKKRKKIKIGDIFKGILRGEITTTKDLIREDAVREKIESVRYNYRSYPDSVPIEEIRKAYEEMESAGLDKKYELCVARSKEKTEELEIRRKKMAEVSKRRGEESTSKETIEDELLILKDAFLKKDKKNSSSSTTTISTLFIVSISDGNLIMIVVVIVAVIIIVFILVMIRDYRLYYSPSYRPQCQQCLRNF